MQGLGKFTTMDELKAKIKENILLEKEYKETQRIQQALLEHSQRMAEEFRGVYQTAADHRAPAFVERSPSDGL